MTDEFKNDYEKLIEILKNNTDDSADKLGVLLTAVALYMLDNYQLTKEELLDTLKKSLEIVENEKELDNE